MRDIGNYKLNNIYIRFIIIVVCKFIKKWVGNKCLLELLKV